MGLEINNVNQIKDKKIVVKNNANISSNTPVNINVGNNDEHIKKLCENFGITSEQYQEIISICPDFLSISDVEKQKEIIENYKNTAVQDLNTVIETDDGLAEAERLRAEYRMQETADKLDYNKLSSPDKKMAACIAAMAKNHFIYGEKDENGEVIDRSDDWGKLSEEQKTNYINQFTQNLKSLTNEDDLKYLKNLAQVKSDNATQKEILDAFMRNIQAANMQGMSFKEFSKLDESERLDNIEMYLREYPEAMNDNDIAYKNTWNNITSRVATIIDKENGVTSASEVDLCPSDARKYIKYHNLNEDELLYEALSEKFEKGTLNPKEKEQYKELNQIFSTDAGKFQIDKAKAANLKKLEEEFNNFDKENGDKYQYEELKKTLNSEEAKRLRNITLPEAKTEFDKKVVADINTFNERIQNHVKGAGVEAGVIASHIELQCKNMTPAERKEYITSFIKFYNGAASGKLFGIYKKEFSDLLDNQELVSQAALGSADMDEAEFERHKITSVAAANSSDEIVCQNGICAINTNSQILSSERCSGSEFDKRKVINAKYNAKVNNVSVLNNTTKTNTTITNASDAVEAQGYITNSEFATDEVHENTVKSAKLFVVGAQAKVMNQTTEKNAHAAAYVAENNLVAGLHKDEQQTAFRGTHQNINKWFTGDEAIKYSKSLANQIQYCDKDNQLAMHNEIMTSKYSEVQEHAAGNIKNYDSSVQAKAIDAVYQTGNQKAIDKAVSNMSLYKSDDVKSQELGRTLGEHSISSEKDLKERFLGGKLTLQEISQLPPSQRREYFVEMYRKATPAQKLQWLSKMPDGTQKKTVYTFIALYDSNLLNSMIENGKGLEMFTVCSDVAAQNKIFALMSKSENNDVKQQCEQIKSDPRNAALFIGKNIEKEPKTAKTLNNFASVPQGFADGLEFFKKHDKFGSFLKA